MSDFESRGLSASFFDGSRGRLFCIHALPKQSRNHTVLLVPAFAEEMNSCRRFFTLLRHELCQQGYTVIQPDLYGTGDSQGLFQEASWEIWVEDLVHLVNSLLPDSESKLSVLSIRSGCLLTQDALRACSLSSKEGSLDRLLYIQPETSGFDVLNKLLRLRVTSNRLAGDSDETTATLWQRFEQQSDVRAAGYQIGHELALQMRESRLDPDALSGVRCSLWVELTPDSSIDVSCSAWQLHRIASKPFWQMHDIEPEQSLIGAIAALVID